MVDISTNVQQLAQIYRHEPVRYISEQLGIELDPTQQDIANSVRDNAFTAVRSGHGTGKTMTASCVGIWFLHNFAHSKVITTAPTFKQVRKVLWSEWRNIARGKLIETESEILDTEMRIADDWFALGVSSDDPNNVSGFHAKHLLFIGDEACGIKQNIYDALMGALTTDAKVLLIVNPTIPEGTFYDAFGKNKNRWSTFHLNCMESPWVSKQWIEHMKEEWGEDSPMYKIRVLGDFAEESEASLLLLKWVERGQEEYITKKEVKKKRIMGFDVAGSGKDLCVWWTIDAYENGIIDCVDVTSSPERDPVKTIGKTIDLYNELKVDELITDRGGLGDAVCAILVERGLNLRPYIGASSPRNPMTHANFLAQSYWTVRAYFSKDMVRGLNHSPTKSQLMQIRYERDSRNIISIVKPGGVKAKKYNLPSKSPDYADAFMMAISGTGTPSITAFDMDLDAL